MRTTTDLADIKLTKLTIPELQERYRQTIGRDTRSTSAAYLQWKIRQAEKGRVRIGPVQRRTAEGEFKVLPLRMEAETVTPLDEARVRLGNEEPHGADPAGSTRVPRPSGRAGSRGAIRGGRCS